MLRTVFRGLAAALCVTLATALLSQAAVVDVVQPSEAGVSSMQLRAKARDAAFVQAVSQEAAAMLPADMSEQRKGLLAAHLAPLAASFVTGYQENAARTDESGLSLTLSVDVNKKALRDHLRGLGLLRSGGGPLFVDLRQLSSMNAQESETLKSLLALSDMTQSQGSMPELTLERVDGRWKGTLRSGDAALAEMHPDLSSMWFAIWGKYFHRQASPAATAGVSQLRMTGWFSADGALEFDQAMRAWEDVAQDVRLLELDVQTSGVSGLWSIGITDRAGFESRLKDAVKGRNLRYEFPGSPVR